MLPATKATGEDHGVDEAQSPDETCSTWRQWAVVRIAVNTTRTMEQRGMSDGGDECRQPYEMGRKRRRQSGR